MAAAYLFHDGFDDLLVGAYSLDDPGSFAGGGYVIFGQPSPVV